jgi:hypothetical protein
VVHNTAGSNRYTKAQVPGIIRGIFNYHVKARKWDDIAYNFLIDKYGGIWEGRGGGIAVNIRGAHANAFNDETAGIALIGDYSRAKVPAAALAALKKLIPWRLAAGGVTNPAGKTRYATNGKTMSVVIGHQDAVYKRGGIWYNQTDCPGKYLAAKLPSLRAGARFPLTDRPKLSGPARTAPGAAITFQVTWDSWRGPVSGKAVIERYEAGAWRSLGTAAVVDGDASFTAAAGGSTQTYRARALKVTAPAGFSLPKPKATSTTTVSPQIVTTAPENVPRVIGPTHVVKDAKASLVLQWQSPRPGFTPKLELQVKKGKKWTTVKRYAVRGSRTVSIKITQAGTYRVKPAASAAPKKAARPVSKSLKIGVLK